MQSIDQIRRERLAMLIKEAGSQTNLSLQTGKGQVQISQWLNATPDNRGKPRVMSNASARQLEHTLKLPEGWMDQPIPTERQVEMLKRHGLIDLGALIDRSPAKRSSLDVSNLADLVSPPSAGPEPITAEGDLPSIPPLSADDYVAVPYVQFKLSAGAHGFSIEYQQATKEPLYFLRSWFRSRGLNPRKVFAADVAGPSMIKTMSDGDTVLVNTDAREAHDDKVFAALYEGELVIKRLSRFDGAWWLMSDNDDQVRFAPKKCDASCKLLGRVVLKMSETI